MVWQSCLDRALSLLALDDDSNLAASGNRDNVGSHQIGRVERSRAADKICERSKRDGHIFWKHALGDMQHFKSSE